MVTIHIVTKGMVCLLVVGSLAAAIAAEETVSEPAQSHASAAELNDRGRYLVKITGCNDCHTPGYAEAAGNVPEKDWLIGDKIGWRGPWGTTYSSNLRLYFQDLAEDQWVTVARTTQFRPPMPWFALRDMTEQDLRAIYRFIRSLGPAGEPAPDYVPPQKEPEGPYILFP
jgi:mono/diheme cytochrome c family protein